MSRVITFSTKFPSHHPRKGEPTLFVEKLYNSFNKKVDFNGKSEEFFMPFEEEVRKLNMWRDIPFNKVTDFLERLENRQGLKPKIHTIRAGSRWKAGDFYSPRIWSAAPYNSKQIIIMPDTEIVRTQRFEILPGRGVFIDYRDIGFFSEKGDVMMELADNDGLSVDDMKAWFRNGRYFLGQILYHIDQKTSYQ
jgi:hypothetical protein